MAEQDDVTKAVSRYRVDAAHGAAYPDPATLERQSLAERGLRLHLAELLAFIAQQDADIAQFEAELGELRGFMRSVESDGLGRAKSRQLTEMVATWGAPGATLNDVAPSPQEGEGRAASDDLRAILANADRYRENMAKAAAAGACPECHASVCVCPQPDKPCQHPARNGRHEVYFRDPRSPQSDCVCRACGARGTVADFGRSEE